MMRLSHTFSRYRSLILMAVLSQLAWSSTVSGRIEVSLAPKASRVRERSLSDIVVWLEPVHTAAAAAVQPEHAELLQKDKMFHPHTLVITAGSTVDFPNADPIFHNAFSTFDGQIFDVGLYPPGTTESVHFRRPGIVRVFCNIHPSMSAVIVVVDTPYFTKADRDGRYQVRNVPAGSYHVHVFDERATTGPDSEVLVTVDEAETTVPAVHLSETAYVQLSHKNKYGLDYPPSSTDAETYTGPPK
jgi:plastocyanin